MSRNTTLLIGGSGTGMTRHFLIPNLINTNSDYVIQDPKAELLYSAVKQTEYKIKSFNLCDIKNISEKGGQNA